MLGQQLVVHVNSKKTDNLRKVIEAIASNLLYACNALSFLQCLGRCDQNVLNSHVYFWTSVARGIWDQLVLSLSHCTDKRKEAMGFPRLFKLVERYKPSDKLCKTARKHQADLQTSVAAKKIGMWRDTLFAHFTEQGTTPDFVRSHKLDMPALESHLRRLKDMLGCYSQELLSRDFAVDKHTDRVKQDFDRVFAAVQAVRESR